MKLSCKSNYSPTHTCQGPAVVYIQYKEKAKDVFIYEKILSNRFVSSIIFFNQHHLLFRSTYHLSIDKYLSEDTCKELCLASLHLENVIKSMESNLKDPLRSEEDKKSQSSSSLLFFHLLSSSSDKLLMMVSVFSTLYPTYTQENAKLASQSNNSSQTVSSYSDRSPTHISTIF